VREATEQAQQVIRRSHEQAEQREAGADTYAAETLRNLREHLLAIEMEISRNILSIEKGLESLGISPQDEEEQMVMEDEGEKSEAPPVQPIPRRASLATDTMGGPTYQ
jgi:hypothetical protein